MSGVGVYVHIYMCEDDEVCVYTVRAYVYT